jgi:acyl dehydratase
MNKSSLDSNRFGLNIHRETTSEIDVKSIRKYIYQNLVDILILRVESLKKEKQSSIASLGFNFIHCDNLVYYKVDLLKETPKQLKNDLIFTEVNHTNVFELENMIPLIFRNYQNHYMSNPFLDKSGIIDGYVEWARAYISGENEGKISWLVSNSDNELVGFATCSYDIESKICEGILYGVLPNMSGGGIYGDLIRYTQNYFKEKEFKEMLVSTQIQNYAVQKVWTREGFYLYNSYDTYHINAFLNNSNTVLEKEVFISKNDVEEFANLSGDTNLVHLDDNYARELGFKSSISHGIRFEMELTKILGSEWPGKGTIILKTLVLYNAPIYPNTKYILSINKQNEKLNGLIDLVTILKNEEDEVINIAYVTIKKNDTL